MRRGKNGEKWPHDHAPEHAQAARLGWKRRRNGIVGKFGGGSRHTEKMNYLKPRKPKAPPKPKQAPKHEESDFIQVKGAKAEKGDTYEMIATQKANKKWVVSRKYKSGLIVQEKGEWTVNPLSMLTKYNKKSAPPARGQDLLFGGEHENRANGIKGLFD